MTRDLNFPIKPEDAGLTIEQFLKSKGISRKMMIRLRNGRGIMVDGLPAITPRKLEEGETLELHLCENEPSPNIIPHPLPFPLVYEDQDLAVVNKPAGMPIHPSQGNFENTLANAAAWYYQQKGQPFTYRVINRLDRDTTGLLILAKHGISACIPSRMSATRETHREYLAIAQGLLPEEGIIDAPIARADRSTILRQVDWQRGEQARTHFRRLLYRKDLDLSLAGLKLETGRTHQIRVHLSYIGHPIPGDFLYCPDYRLISRQALHSYRLRFRHPITRETMEFTAPLPQDMNRLLTAASEDLLDNDFSKSQPQL